MNNIYIQALGVVALIVFAGGFYLKDRRQILGAQILALAIWSLHYYLLGAKAGSVLSLVAAARSGLFYFKDAKNWIGHPAVLVSLLLVIAAAALLTGDGLISILPAAGISFATISHWQNVPQRIRVAFLPAPVLWFAYNFLVGSFAGLVNETILFLATLGSILKHKIGKKGKVERFTAKVH